MRRSPSIKVCEHHPKPVYFDGKYCPACEMLCELRGPYARPSRSDYAPQKFVKSIDEARFQHITRIHR